MAAFFIGAVLCLKKHHQDAGAVTLHPADKHSGKKSGEEVERTGETRSYS
jgi:hypothetical protein